MLSGHLIRQSPRKISPSNRRVPFLTVIPAKAGIQKHWTGLHSDALDSRLRGNDGEEVAGYDPLVRSSCRLCVERISCYNYDSPHKVHQRIMALMSSSSLLWEVLVLTIR
jgi:hypothetical protein